MMAPDEYNCLSAEALTGYMPWRKSPVPHGRYASVDAEVLSRFITGTWKPWLIGASDPLDECDAAFAFKARFADFLGEFTGHDVRPAASVVFVVDEETESRRVMLWFLLRDGTVLYVLAGTGECLTRLGPREKVYHSFC